jgi:hypothetical protein
MVVIVARDFIDPAVNAVKYSKGKLFHTRKTRNSHLRGNVLDELPSTVKNAQPRRPLLQFKSILSNLPARNESV